MEVIERRWVPTFKRSSSFSSLICVHSEERSDESVSKRKKKKK